MNRTDEWLCCQLGAREHYAVPRALHRLGHLRSMVTDAWVRPGSPIGRLPGELPRRLAQRYHRDLATADVHDFTAALLIHEAKWWLRRESGWPLVMRRNAWFQRHAAAQLAAHSPAPGARVTVFAHSYSARAIFETAKARGWSTVLGQIDPGEEHFAIVRRLEDLRPEYGPPSAKPPVEYFQSWRAECALADRIVVNSQWSREALIKAGIDADRIAVVPLAADDAEGAHRRSYPQRFSVERPLRLLFVGSASVIKGAPELLDAMMRLRDAPVRLLMVGEPGNIPASVTGGAAIEWTGAVPRGDLAVHYGANDVLVFPSHSDGFGMAQVEAQDWGMPVIASRSCGNVVVDGWNGLLLPEVSADAIANAVQALLDAPHRLAEFAAHAVSGPDGMRRLGSSLAQLASLDHASA